MNTNFEACLAVTLRFEGGFANNPRDPGGRTMRGITQKVYDAYRLASGGHVADVAGITDSDLRAIYRAQYWDVVKGDSLPEGVDLVVFDYAVNSGGAQATRDLQRALGAPVDGVVGAVTLAGVQVAGNAGTINALCDRRLSFMRGLKRWRDFGNGWADRVAGVRAAALAMAGADLTPHPTSAAKAQPTDQAKLRTPEGAGLTTAAVGASGNAILGAAQQIQPHINDTMFGKIALIGFILIGALGGLLIVYSYFKRIKEAGGLAGFVTSLGGAASSAGGGAGGG